MSSSNPTGSDTTAPKANPESYHVGRENLMTDAQGNTYEINTTSGTRMINHLSNTINSNTTDLKPITETNKNLDTSGTGNGGVSGNGGGSGSKSQANPNPNPNTETVRRKENEGLDIQKEEPTGVKGIEKDNEKSKRNADSYGYGRENLMTDAGGNVFEINTSTGMRMVGRKGGSGVVAGEGGKDKNVLREEDE